MIEKCTKKRMLIFIILLVGLSIAIVLLEHHLTQSSHYSSHLRTNHSSEADNQCWLTEKFSIVEECHTCTEFEKTSQTVASCVSTGFKEKVRCETSGDVFKSCEKIPWLEEKRFWMLEIVSLILGLISSTFVVWRQRILERQMMFKIQQQINS